ncbi:TorF family putative porin [Sphingomonas sp. GC_Shp_6]|uniref:TorF family putative porin n=1 Tax=Sphingomonas sp. GC_Shp_6 TaxID=2937378 RepID=UPI00226A3C0F|nr:TorF family putative porin [Sphingomonas sp. GC_Shp_6]
MRRSTLLLGCVGFALAAQASAQDTAPPPPLKLTGSVTLVSDYRFRGLTQTDGSPAVQGTLNLNHSSGLYVGTFVSNIDGTGTTPALAGYGQTEIDLYGGYTHSFHGATFDGGLLYYYYPGGLKGQNTDYFEPYASLGYTIGPIAAKVGANYAWGGQKGLDFTAGKDDDIYVYGEASIAVPRTPVTLKGHVGHTAGSLGLDNPSLADDNYWDWSANAEAVGGPIKVGVTYVDTDITEANRFARRLGRGSTVFGYVGVSF